MMTLDDVISKIELAWACPSSDEGSEYCDLMEVRDDALHYLKMYRSDQEQWGFFQKNYEDELKQKIKDFGDAKERFVKRLKELDIGTLNDPLTWSELRQMEGKPVWIEADNGQEQFKHWFIIDEFTFTDIPGLQIMWCLNNSFRFWEADIGKTWQAYRKER